MALGDDSMEGDEVVAGVGAFLVVGVARMAAFQVWRSFSCFCFQVSILDRFCFRGDDEVQVVGSGSGVIVDLLDDAASTGGDGSDVHHALVLVSWICVVGGSRVLLVIVSSDSSVYSKDFRFDSK